MRTRLFSTTTICRSEPGAGSSEGPRQPGVWLGMSEDSIEHVGRQAACALTVDGLSRDVTNLARAVASTFREQRRTIERLESELHELRSSSEQELGQLRSEVGQLQLEVGSPGD